MYCRFNGVVLRQVSLFLRSQIAVGITYAESFDILNENRFFFERITLYYSL